MIAVMTRDRRRRLGSSRVLAAGLVALSLSACATEYHGPHSDIDSVLWMQVAGLEDPFLSGLHRAWEGDPQAFADSLPGARWDGTPDSVERLDIGDGGVVVYDVSPTRDGAEFSVFVSSGPRAEQIPGREKAYTGPSAVFTCSTVTVVAHADGTLSTRRTTLDGCPAPLVEALPDDAAFASAEVFDG